MAVSQGMDIDGVFRNEQGIYSQMMRMESTPISQVYSVKPATRLFLDAVALFKDNRPDFDALIEAKAMVMNGKSHL